MATVGVAALYQSTIGKKVAMALSGAVYVGWVVQHVVGNMQFHLGPAAINDYAHFLQSMHELVWFGRSALLVAIVVHVVSAISLIQHNASARKVPYQGPKNTYYTSSAAKAMRYGGFALLAFILWHLLDLTVRAYVDFPMHALSLGYAGKEYGFIHGEVYHNMVLSFTDPVSLLVYVVAMALLGLHLYHGVWSMFQTLGLEAATKTDFWRQLAAGIAALVVVGNLTIIGHAVYAGVVADYPTITGHGAVYYGETVDVPKTLQVAGVELHP